MKREIEQFGRKYIFDHWAEKIKPPAWSGGEEVDIVQEAIFVDKDGNMIGVSKDHPKLNDS